MTSQILGMAALGLLSACGGGRSEAETSAPPEVQVAPAAVAPPQQARAEALRMDLEELDLIVREMATDVGRDGGVWELTHLGVRLAIVTDTRHDRMRVVAPIIAEAEMTPDQRRLVLEANFHTALDARYATTHGMLYAAFIHPLSPLTKDELQSAIRQVATLARTFGTSYSSGELVFGAPGR